eukprot:scaffold138948_cov31-Tisochrysis_lutea.AAC.2
MGRLPCAMPNAIWNVSKAQMASKPMVARKRGELAEGTAFCQSRISVASTPAQPSSATRLSADCHAGRFSPPWEGTGVSSPVSNTTPTSRRRSTTREMVAVPPPPNSAPGV